MATLMSNRQVKTGTLAAMGQSWERFQNTKTQNTNCNMSINLFQWYKCPLGYEHLWVKLYMNFWTPTCFLEKVPYPSLGLELICLASVAGQQDIGWPVSTSGTLGLQQLSKGLLGIQLPQEASVEPYAISTDSRSHPPRPEKFCLVLFRVGIWIWL